MSLPQLTLWTKTSRSNVTIQLVGLFAIVLVLEYSTHNSYVFGYFYTGPILLASSRLGRTATVWATTAAVLLTIFNLWIPGESTIQASTVANRFIAALALVITGVLSDRNRRYQQTMTQQQAKLQAQEQLTRLREDFASTLTHDLKTPLLGAIETLLAFQQEQFGSVTTAQQKVLETMRRSHQNSLQLVETLLDVYRNDAEGLALQLAPVDLAVLAEDVLLTLTELASNRQVHLSLSYAGSEFRQSLWVKGDAFQLQRVLTNLLVNAVNHSRRGERVEIILEPQSSYQVVKILDTGAGIKSDEFPYLFEQFYQGDSDRQAKGSGLGLYLSRQIVEAHGGTIWAENRIPRGALFGFKLPSYPFQSAE